jgi:ABC-type polar amino acid transport system ATPase subunit
MKNKFLIIIVIIVLLFNIQACYATSIIEPNFITVKSVYMEENSEDYLARAKDLLEKVGLSELEKQLPKRLSTG